ncbi:MAG: MerR family transcriptional regulator [Bdellovibrionaceae bacterium]|nr:MerR family transcriptional regulator [Pseudobdellovibrionaceae bacterium]
MQNINIKAVSKMTGINENTIRAWERRYNVVEPERSADGRRLYSRKDVEKLSLLWKLVQKGHLIGQIASLSVVQLKKMDGEHVAGELVSESAKEQVHLETIISSLKKFDLDAIHHSLQKARFELSPRDIITRLILPLLKAVGTEVMDSKLSISQEHLLSSLLRDHLGNVYQSLSPYEYKVRSLQTRVIITTREGDLHEFSILLAAILCRIHGYETYYLGPNMPMVDLAHACEQFKINFVILGLAALPPEKEFVAAANYLKQLDQALPKKMQFLCGGMANVPMNVISSGRKYLFFSSIDELDTFLAQNR